MLQKNYLIYYIFNILFFSTTITISAQTGNFDETWKEFLENNKISNMSTLVRPNKAYKPLDYAKYLLMNTNTSFCQSDLEDAEGLMAEIQQMPSELHKAIPGFPTKMEDLKSKMEAYHQMDAVWQKFLETKDVTLEELEAITAAKTSCEKQTLAKYSYMTAYFHFCAGDIWQSQQIFENRTLRLAEKTSLRVEDVPGLAEEVAKMKKLYQGVRKLDKAWQSYVDTDVSPGFEEELPLYICNPIPNMKEYLLRGAADVCSQGLVMLDKVKDLQEQSGVVPDREIKNKMDDLETAILNKNEDLLALNAAWLGFLPENTVQRNTKYGYDFCDKEPLIKAYIMDGFVFVCDLAEESLRKIEELQATKPVRLDATTQSKIDELGELYMLYQFNGDNIERIWENFIARGDILQEDYESTNLYCDNVQEVKDWTMKGLSGDCKEGHEYLEKIDALVAQFDFDFYEELECRVQNLRIKRWDCRHEVLAEIARLEAPDAFEEKLEELLTENRMGPRPELCASLSK